MGSWCKKGVTNSSCTLANLLLGFTKLSLVHFNPLLVVMQGIAFAQLTEGAFDEVVRIGG